MTAARPVPHLLREPRHVIATLRLLVLAGISLIGVSRVPSHPHLFWLCTTVYGVTIFGYLWARNRDYDLRRVKWAMFLFDIAIVGLLIVLCGDRPSEFLTAYFGLVLMAAIAEGVGHAITNAVLVSCLFAILTQRGLPLREVLTAPVLSQFAFFLVVALFMGHLADESRTRAADRDRAREALAARSSELRASTERLKEARETLRAQDRLATLGMLSAGIAHELKNPLAAIVANLDPAEEIVRDMLGSELVRREFDGDVEELVEIIEDCRISSLQLQRVARDLTSVARGSARESQPIDAAEMLESVRRMLVKSAADEVRIDVHAGTSRVVLADRVRLIQVLLNLGSNALDALGSQSDGVLTLSARDGEDGTVLLVVEDNGPGIPDDVRRRMFEPFFTTKPSGQGTGLGLHLVKEMVGALSGDVSCTTEAAVGTTFVVSLPGQDATGDEGARDHDDTRDEVAHRRRRRAGAPCTAAYVEA